MKKKLPRSVFRSGLATFLLAEILLATVLLATVLLATALLLSGCASPEPVNLIFISLDTTRKDHLTTYGYERDTAPFIDRLAQKSAVFDNAVTQWTTTNPSHTSMFSGLYPKTHGVGSNTRKLAPEHFTLAEILRDAGFVTGAFVSGYPLRLAREGVGQGFETYDSDFKKMRRDGTLTTQRALDWLATLDPARRFFVFLHLYDAHGPYRPKDEYRDLFRSEDPGPELDAVPGYQKRKKDGPKVHHLNDYVDRYDALIRYQDDLVARLLSAVDLERTVVLITADHGETLGERALVLDHGKNLFEEQVGIPLILHAPGFAPGRFQPLVETVDFLPTLLEILGVEAPEGLMVEGRSLVPLLTAEQKGDPQKPAFSSVRAWARAHKDRGYFLDKTKRIHSVRAQRWKLIVYPGTEEEHLELYDLENDPLEKRNVAADHPDVRDRLRELIAAWQAGEVDEAEELELTSEDAEKLRSLGYLD